MEIPKPSNDDKQRFRSLVPDGPGVEIKPMFGNLAGFVNGNMFMGLFGAAVGLRLPDEERDAARLDGAGPFGPPDRPMREYVAAPESWSGEELARWVDKALAHVSTFPPKEPKKRARR